MSTETTVIYNDTCPICSREIAHYRKRCAAVDADLRFEPISNKSIQVAGLSRDDAARRLHVIKDSKLLIGVDGFIVLWKETPGFQWLGRLVALPGIRQLAVAVYEGVLAPILYGMHKRRERRSRT